MWMQVREISALNLRRHGGLSSSTRISTLQSSSSHCDSIPRSGRSLVTQPKYSSYPSTEYTRFGVPFHHIPRKLRAPPAAAI
jgi:hypothetical protein